MRHRLIGAAVAVLVLSGAIALGTATSGTAGAATTQFTFFNQNVTHTSTSYAAPAISAETPANWVSPINYAAGRMYLRFEVLSKPTNKTLQVQMCLWRSNYTIETCSGTTDFSGTGVHWIDLGRPNDWWKKNGNWSWTIPFSPVRLMIKDKATGKLFLTNSCGAYCSTETAVAGHLPLSIHASSVVVAPGAQLQPISGWNGCPSSWSPNCGGANTTTTTVATTTTKPTTTTTPNTTTTAKATTTTTTTTTPTGAKVVALVAGSNPAPSGDRATVARLGQTGWTVRTIDDDALTPASLNGARAVIVSSSVVPTKIPTWLADTALPVLNSEVYAGSTLRMAGGSRTEVADQTKLQIVNAASPLAAGLSGDVTVQSPSLISRSTPAPGAQTVARLPGSASASIYSIERGAAMTSGSAPARRVGWYWGYTSPSATGANGWALFDAAMNWLAA
jgi:hypothetical protein